MRSALSMRVSGKPSAVSTGLLCPFAHAEPLDTYTPISERRLSTGSENIAVKLYEQGRILIRVRDTGCGIENIEKAMEPLFTTGGEERAGLGFAVMQSFCGSVRVTSAVGRGTSVTLTKYFDSKQ